MTDKLHWQRDLHAPERPCIVEVEGLGLVEVTGNDIKRAHDLSGRAVFEVRRHSPSFPVAHYYLGAAEGE